MSLEEKAIQESVEFLKGLDLKNSVPTSEELEEHFKPVERLPVFNPIILMIISIIFLVMGAITGVLFTLITGVTLFIASIWIVNRDVKANAIKKAYMLGCIDGYRNLMK